MFIYGVQQRKHELIRSHRNFKMLLYNGIEKLFFITVLNCTFMVFYQVRKPNKENFDFEYSTHSDGSRTYTKELSRCFHLLIISKHLK